MGVTWAVHGRYMGVTGALLGRYMGVTWALRALRAMHDRRITAVAWSRLFIARTSSYCLCVSQIPRTLATPPHGLDRYATSHAVTCRYLPLPTVPTPQDLGREPTVQELDADREEAFKRELEERLGRPPFAKELAMYEAEAGLAPGGHLTEGGAPAGAPGQVR